MAGKQGYYRFKGAKKSVKETKTIKPTGENLSKINKKVNRIEKSLKKSAEIIHCGDYMNDSMSADVDSYCLTKYSQWTNIFGGSSDDNYNNQAIHKSFGIDCRLSLQNGLNTETDSISYTFFLVSLTDEANNILDLSTGQITLTAGLHYYLNNNGGGAFINKKMFKILKVKRIEQSNFGQALSVASAGAAGLKPTVRWYWKIQRNSIIKNPTGNWKALPCNRDPSKNLFILGFNNNSGADGEFPNFQYSAVHTIQVDGA